MDVIKLEELEIYQLAIEIGEYVWNIVDPWEWFPKKTVGIQLCKCRRLYIGKYF